MPTYAILFHPGHNRVYFKTAKALAREELACLTKTTKNSKRLPISDIREENFGGLDYLCFDSPEGMPGNSLRILSRLSFAYGVFLVRRGELNAPLLSPLNFAPNFSFDESLNTILKYTGKTNELFTRMLLNIAVGFGAQPGNGGILDPLCGKGTTLFEGLLQGFTNVCGIEADEKTVHESYTFLKKYLERERVKHSSHIERVGGLEHGGRAKRYQIKGAAKNGNFSAEIIAGDTRDGLKFFGKNKFGAIIGDLPYGVQHAKNRKAPSLIHQAAPVWHKLLKPGGVLVLAWNLFTNSRAEMEAALQAAGFKLQPTGDFRHRVDQAIERDVIVGKKP